MCQNPRNFHCWEILHVPHTNAKLYLSQSPPIQPASNVRISLESTFSFPGSFLFVIVFKSKAWPKTSKTLHPWSLTWNLKIISWKRRFLLETILFRFHVKLQGVQTDTSNWSIVMPRSSVFGIRIGGVVLKAEKFARTWRLEKWKGVVGTPNNKFQEVNMSRFFWHWVFYGYQLPQPDFSMSFLGHIDSDMETKNFRRFSTGRNGETNQFKGNVEKKPKLFNNQSFT